MPRTETSIYGEPPVGFPAVMALGIVSVSAAELGSRALSLLLLGAAVAAYALAAATWTRRRPPVTPASFAAVAATAVLGTRLALARVHVVPDVALALAVGTWVLTWLGIRRSRDFGAASGTRLLVVVATQSLVVLTTFCARWAAPAALVVFAAGAALHPAVLVRLPPRELRDSPGDVWIVMGAIAITTLAAARLSLVTARRPMEVVAVILWALATAMLPVLVAAEVRWPRLRFHPKRWATVFPLGMYAAASVTVAHTTHLAALTVARVAFWAAVVVAVAAAAGAGHAALRVRAHR